MGVVGFFLGLFVSKKMLEILSKSVTDLTKINHDIIQHFYNYRDEVKKFIDQAENEVKNIRESLNKK